MKVYIQVIDTQSGIYQSGMVDENVVEGEEIKNALKHFGVNYSTVKWTKIDNFLFGPVEGTFKVVQCYS